MVRSSDLLRRQDVAQDVPCQHGHTTFSPAVDGRPRGPIKPGGRATQYGLEAFAKRSQPHRCFFRTTWVSTGKPAVGKPRNTEVITRCLGNFLTQEEATKLRVSTGQVTDWLQNRTNVILSNRAEGKRTHPDPARQ